VILPMLELVMEDVGATCNLKSKFYFGAAFLAGGVLELCWSRM
jgi:hypothetical protein